MVNHPRLRTAWVRTRLPANHPVLLEYLHPPAPVAGEAGTTTPHQRPVPLITAAAVPDFLRQKQRGPVQFRRPLHKTALPLPNSRCTRTTCTNERVTPKAWHWTAVARRSPRWASVEHPPTPSMILFVGANCPIRLGPATTSVHAVGALTALQERPPHAGQRSGGGQKPPPLPQGCIRREEASEAAPEAVRQAVGGGCQSGWGRLLSVINAIEAGTWRQGNSGWA